MMGIRKENGIFLRQTLTLFGKYYLYIVKSPINAVRLVPGNSSSVFLMKLIVCSKIKPYSVETPACYKVHFRIDLQITNRPSFSLLTVSVKK